MEDPLIFSIESLDFTKDNGAITLLLKLGSVYFEPLPFSFIFFAVKSLKIRFVI